MTTIREELEAAGQGWACRVPSSLTWYAEILKLRLALKSHTPTPEETTMEDQEKLEETLEALRVSSERCGELEAEIAAMKSATRGGLTENDRAFLGYRAEVAEEEGRTGRAARFREILERDGNGRQPPAAAPEPNFLTFENGSSIAVGRVDGEDRIFSTETDCLMVPAPEPLTPNHERLLHNVWICIHGVEAGKDCGACQEVANPTGKVAKAEPDRVEIVGDWANPDAPMSLSIAPPEPEVCDGVQDITTPGGRKLCVPCPTCTKEPESMSLGDHLTKDQLERFGPLDGDTENAAPQEPVEPPTVSKTDMVALPMECKHTHAGSPYRCRDTNCAVSSSPDAEAIAAKIDERALAYAGPHRSAEATELARRILDTLDSISDEVRALQPQSSAYAESIAGRMESIVLLGVGSSSIAKEAARQFKYHLDAFAVEVRALQPQPSVEPPSGQDADVPGLIRKLLEADEGSELVLHSPNADFGSALPDWVIDYRCSYDQIADEPMRAFRGETLTECLQKAVEGLK